MRGHERMRLASRVKKIEEEILKGERIVVWIEEEMGELTEEKLEELRERGMEILIEL